MNIAVQGWRDVAGLVGIVLFCAFLLTLLPWPSYRDADFVSRADREDAERQLEAGRERERARQVRGT